MTKNILSIQKIKKHAHFCFSVVALFFFLTIAAVFLSPASKNYPVSLLPAMASSEHFQRLAFNIFQARTSLLKSLNITHIPYWFAPTDLPVFEIVLEPDALRVMNNNLPQNLKTGRLGEENKVFVNALFKHGAYNSEVEIRYRGLFRVHWLRAKRSMLVKFPKENLFDGVKSFDLIVPRDRLYLAEIMQNERIKRSGLVSRNIFFVRVLVNNKDAGVYIAKERFSKQWLEKNGIPKDSEIFSQSSDPPLKTPTITTQLLGPENFWRRDIHEDNSSFDELRALFYLIGNPADTVFEKNIGSIIDLQKWYKAIAINVFAGKAHSMTGGDLNLLFNSSTGRFEPLLEDVGIYKTGPETYLNPQEVYEGFDLISKRILRNKKFYKEYLEILKNSSGQKELEIDLEFYDALYSRLKNEFYKDQTKYRNDFTVTRMIDAMREVTQENQKNAQFLTTIPDPAIPTPHGIGKSDVSALPDSFKHLFDITLRPREFTARHPEFKVRNGEIILPRGTYTFSENIIIPKDTRLVIEPGSKMYLSPGVSIISYSPISAIGTKDSPIFVGRKNEEGNWGSIAVINVEKKSEFRYMTLVAGSSSAPINGVTFTGMISAHNAPLYVFDSQFYRDGDDDMISAKYSTGEIARSKFFDSAGDAIDLDMTDGFLIANNYFSNIGTGPNGGDAIDLSFSDAYIFGNTVNRCSDKGISVGEKSTPLIEGNKITRCVIGIAVKDSSQAAITNNELLENHEGVSLYQRKAVFKGAEAVLRDNVFAGNGTNIKKDEVSKITYENTK